MESSDLSLNVAAVLAAEAGAQLLANEALADTVAPKSLTGCVSALSSFAPVNHSYTDALKNYGEVYEQFQSYLSPLDKLSEHDYDQAIAMSMPEGAHIGCLNHDMVEFVAGGEFVTEEEIEDCGYMGWLRH
jgi:uncharacterized protein YozE (UPF0346 family)